MSPIVIGSFASLLWVLELAALSPGGLANQYSPSSRTRQDRSEWESDRIRVRTISVEPGARLAAPQAGTDRVLVFLTADLDGHMPSADAVWQPASEPERENRGRSRVDALVVDVKAAPDHAGGGPPLEALSSGDGINARVLIDNPRVVVIKLRYSQHLQSVDAPHLHAQDALVVYLAGGYTLLPAREWGYPARVRRGEFDVVPAQTFHRFANASGDPLEFLVIIPK
jgi:quercetin dioxygenase-like cupin family protein